jgi:hypothetical protein
MNQVTPFVISEFTNPSGEIVFRVSGWLDGERVRKNFSTRAEAKAELRSLEIRLVQGESGIRTAITRLTDEQIQEAEAAFLRVRDRPQSLLVYLDYALTNYRSPEPEQSLDAAIAEYVAAKQREHERGLFRRFKSPTSGRSSRYCWAIFPAAPWLLLHPRN